ncbi:hypothetical protein BDV12DRAFT_186734 [Aspergillus spectabilis]
MTRACDNCKRRKCKCDGLEGELDATRTKRRSMQMPRLNEAVSDSTNGADEARLSTETEGDARDASTHAFLKSVYTHLQSMGQVLPRNLRRPAEQILEGDSPASIFFPPTRQVAQEYVDCFYEHSNATYRYIPKSQIQHLMDGFYAQEERVLQDDAGVVILLLVMAVGCVWLASWRNLDLGEQKGKGSRLFKSAKRRLEQAAAVFPPTIPVLQGHVLECEFYLALNMFNTAWITVGTAVRLGQMIGFQKVVRQDLDLQEYSRRGIFWSLYMMDRYLSAALGRPMALDDADITIPYPETPEVALQVELGQNETRLMKGVIAHIRLTQITSKILKQLYSANQCGLQSRDEIVLEIEQHLKDWLQDTPSFFHRADEHETENIGDMIFCDIPWIFRRQKRTVRAAFHFTTVLLYRGYLLDELLQRNVPRQQALSCSPAVRKCVQAALRLAEFAAEIETDETYNPVYWVTSHFTFCAISILTVYMTLYKDPEQQSLIEVVLEKAMRGHRKLDNSRNKQSQQLLEVGLSTAFLVILTKEYDLQESRSIARAIQESPTACSATTTLQSRPDWLYSLQPTEDHPTTPIGTDTAIPEEDHHPVELYNEQIWDPQSYASILPGEGLGVIMSIGFDTSLSPLNDLLPT